MNTHTRLIPSLLVATAIVMPSPLLAAESTAVPESSPEQVEACLKKAAPQWGNPAERFAGHLDELKTALKLTPDQTAVWAQWSEQVKQNMQGVKAQRPDFRSLETLPVPERMEKLLTFGKERQAKLEEGLRSTKALYAVLTTEQRQTFDKEFRFWQFGHKPHRP